MYTWWYRVWALRDGGGVFDQAAFLPLRTINVPVAHRARGVWIIIQRPCHSCWGTQSWLGCEFCTSVQGWDKDNINKKKTQSLHWSTIMSIFMQIKTICSISAFTFQGQFYFIWICLKVLTQGTVTPNLFIAMATFHDLFGHVGHLCSVFCLINYDITHCPWQPATARFPLGVRGWIGDHMGHILSHITQMITWQSPVISWKFKPIKNCWK